MKEGTLFVVATPIGNLGDLSPRAREVLHTVDLIAAEDTRVTGRLLSHFGIKCRQKALHEHNEEALCDELIAVLLEGRNIALVSDAGTPLISDPGFRLLRAAHRAGITVTPLPGASALLVALSASGLPTDRFAFEGFLPARKPARQKRLRQLAAEPRTTVFFESVHRVAAAIDDLVGTHGAGRAAFIGRELTKLHEQCISADLGTLAAMLADGRIAAKGEFVIVVAGAAGEADDADDDAGIDIDRLLGILVEALPGKQAAAVAARISGRPRNDLYRRMLQLKAAAGE